MHKAMVTTSMCFILEQRSKEDDRKAETMRVLQTLLAGMKRPLSRTKKSQGVKHSYWFLFFREIPILFYFSVYIPIISYFLAILPLI